MWLQIILHVARRANRHRRQPQPNAGAYNAIAPIQHSGTSGENGGGVLPREDTEREQRYPSDGEEDQGTESREQTAWVRCRERNESRDPDAARGERAVTERLVREGGVRENERL